jgi:hypothetical protein
MISLSGPSSLGAGSQIYHKCRKSAFRRRKLCAVSMTIRVQIVQFGWAQACRAGKVRVVTGPVDVDEAKLGLDRRRW